jgi:hypothetical protein
MYKLLIGLSLGLLLAGCHDKVYSVDYYKAHESEAKEQIISCSGSHEPDSNCFNANEALSQLDQSKIQKSISNVKW